MKSDVKKNSSQVSQWVQDAEERIRQHILETPLEYSSYVSDLIEGETYLKLDIMQKTGSFKFRGAVNKILSMSDEEISKGIVAASSGNFALALGEAVKLRGHRATIFVAKDLDPFRLELIKSYGLDVVVDGAEALDAENKARQVAIDEDRIYVSPYNDPAVIGGQGTCGVEIMRQLPDVDAVFVAIGGGGLCSGIGGWLKAFNPDIKIIGVSPENSPVMYESLKAGKVIEMDFTPTLADTCAGGVDPNTITLALLQKYMDDMILVTEQEIEDSVRLLFEQHRLVTEGSSAMTVGALLKRKESFKGKKVVLVNCGRNIGIDLFKQIVA